MRMKHNQKGFSLAEVVVFIALLSVISVMIFTSYREILRSPKVGSRSINEQALAQERLELVLGQVRQNGFSNYTDPCSTRPVPTICSSTLGYTVNSPTEENIADANISTVTAERKITVRVQHSDGTSVSFVAYIGNY